MCAPALIPLAIGVGMGALQGMGQRDQANAQASALRQNAAYQYQAAQDALDRGRKAADRQRVDTQGAIGTQRTAMAGNGGEINEGTNALIQQDTAQFGELDALTISNNAAREAYGYQVQAQTDENNAARTQAAGRKAMFSSIIGGAVSGISAGGGFSGLFGGGAGAASGAGTQAALSGNLNLLGPRQAYS